MRWVETAHVPFLLLAACSSEARPWVAFRRTAAIFWLLSPRARYGDSLHIHPFHPAKEEKVGAAESANGRQLRSLGTLTDSRRMTTIPPFFKILGL